MTTLTRTIYLTLDVNKYLNPPEFYLMVSMYKPENESEIVAATEVSYKVPEGLSPVAHALHLIDAEKARALAEYQKRVAELSEQAAKLQAIEG